MSTLAGQAITLEPLITGMVQQYVWTPAAGLSDPSVRNPIASPVHSTIYSLQVIAAGGCTANGKYTVDVGNRISVPNAFTPNNDGSNDVFYVIGGQDGDMIKEFSIFNRWGQLIFEAKNCTPGDPGYGWTGMAHGQPAPAGGYVYLITLQKDNGLRKIYKGSFILIR